MSPKDFWEHVEKLENLSILTNFFLQIFYANFF